MPVSPLPTPRFRQARATTPCSRKPLQLTVSVVLVSVLPACTGLMEPKFRLAEATEHDCANAPDGICASSAPARMRPAGATAKGGSRRHLPR